MIVTKDHGPVADIVADAVSLLVLVDLFCGLRILVWLLFLLVFVTLSALDVGDRFLPAFAVRDLALGRGFPSRTSAGRSCDRRLTENAVSAEFASVLSIVRFGLFTLGFGSGYMSARRSGSRWP